MQIHKRIKDRPRAIRFSHQSKHFDHGFSHNSSHKYCKENNKQSTNHHKEKVKLDGDGTYLSGIKAMQEKWHKGAKKSLKLLQKMESRGSWGAFGEFWREWGKWGEIWLHPSPFLFFLSIMLTQASWNFFFEFFFWNFLLSLLLYIFPS